MTTSHVAKTCNLSVVPSPEVLATDHVDYEHGFHEKWEAWLHHRRYQAEQAGIVLSSREEIKRLETWLTVNHATASEPTRCSVCTRQIEIATARGDDPFKCPNSIKEEVRKYGTIFKRL